MGSVSFLGSALVPALNHLLQDARWARTRLLPFAGQTVGVSLGELRFGLIVTERGDFASHIRTSDDAEEAVRIEFPAETARHLLQDLLRRQTPDLWREARVSGSVAFAEALSFVFRNLNWDVEADLAKLVGDIAAHRLTRLGASLQQRLRQAGEEMEHAVSRQLSTRLVGMTDWQKMVEELKTLCSDVDALTERVDRLAARAR